MALVTGEEEPFFFLNEGEEEPCHCISTNPKLE